MSEHSELLVQQPALLDMDEIIIRRLFRSFHDSRRGVIFPNRTKWNNKFLGGDFVHFVNEIKQLKKERFFLVLTVVGLLAEI